MTRERRWSALGHGGATLWFTGLPGAGKSTVAAAVEERLLAAGRPAFLLDGDNLRHGLNGDLGFDEQARARERAPHRARRAAARRVGDDRARQPRQPLRRRPRRPPPRCTRPTSSSFIEIFVDAPLELCEQRDPKGLYARARAGELAGMTGVGAPYEPPDRARPVLGSRRRNGRAGGRARDRAAARARHRLDAPPQPRRGRRLVARLAVSRRGAWISTLALAPDSSAPFGSCTNAR